MSLFYRWREAMPRVLTSWKSNDALSTSQNLEEIQDEKDHRDLTFTLYLHPSFILNQKQFLCNGARVRSTYVVRIHTGRNEYPFSRRREDDSFLFLVPSISKLLVFDRWLPRLLYPADWILELGYWLLEPEATSALSDQQRSKQSYNHF